MVPHVLFYSKNFIKKGFFVTILIFLYRTYRKWFLEDQLFDPPRPYLGSDIDESEEHRDVPW